MGQRQVKVSVEEDDTSTPILMENLSEESKEKEDDLHRLAYLGFIDEIRELLDRDDFSGESLVRKLDSANMTPVHNAAFGVGNRQIEIVEMLLKHDLDDVRTSPNNLDPLVNLVDEKGRTVLHYAADSKRPALIAKLLNEFEADPNLIDYEGCSPVHICASKGYSEEAVTCVEVLLKSPLLLDKFQSCGPQKQEQTPIHLASGAMADKMLKFLLMNGFHPSKLDNRGFTPLYLAASAGDTPEAVACVQELLKVYEKKDVNAKSQIDGQTALHVASFKCHQNVISALLKDANTDIWVLDNQKRTALHWATEAWFRAQSLACVKLLVESEKVADWQMKAKFLFGDNNGDEKKPESPVDIALKYKSIRIAEYLLESHPTPAAWLDDKMLEKVYTILPEAMIPLMNSKGITYKPAEFHERNESIEAEFGLITGFKDPVEDEVKQETKYLHKILNSPKEIQRNLLLHPLVQIFIDLKWKKIRLITYIAILFQFVWLALYSLLIFEVYVPDCVASTPLEGSTESTASGDNTEKIQKKTKAMKFWLSLGLYSKENSNIDDCDYDTEAATLITIILYIMTLVVIIKEIFQMRNNTKYFKSLTNWAQWALMVIFVLNTIPVFSSDPVIANWQMYLAAFGIGLGWILSLREVGKLPNCGLYAAMLKKVSWHCGFMLAFYFPLLLSFAFTFRLLLPGKGQYKYALFAIVKVVIMMTGELDFEDAFYKDDAPQLQTNYILGQVAFMVLVFVTTIVLLNLLTGLAVNDVKSLIEQAEVNRLSNQLEQIFLLESLFLRMRTFLGKDKLISKFHCLNVTSIILPDYSYFASRTPGIETRHYSPELKERMKKVMVPESEE